MIRLGIFFYLLNVLQVMRIILFQANLLIWSDPFPFFFEFDFPLSFLILPAISFWPQEL
jgi:hypothetical protein